MKLNLIISFLLLGVISLAQVEPEEDYQDEIGQNEVDSVDWGVDENVVDLGEMTFYSLELKTNLEKKYYLWLKKRVLEVYPYAEKAADEYESVKDSAALIEKKRDRKKYIKKEYKKLADSYEEKLKDFSTSRGQILSKLIHRQTGKTSYEIIKEMRGGFNAFMWNAAGGAFDIDLKQGFDPHKTREDLFIEVIIQRAIRDDAFIPIKDSVKS